MIGDRVPILGILGWIGGLLPIIGDGVPILLVLAGCGAGIGGLLPMIGDAVPISLVLAAVGAGIGGALPIIGDAVPIFRVLSGVLDGIGRSRKMNPACARSRLRPWSSGVGRDVQPQESSRLPAYWYSRPQPDDPLGALPVKPTGSDRDPQKRARQAQLGCAHAHHMVEPGHVLTLSRLKPDKPARRFAEYPIQVDSAACPAASRSPTCAADQRDRIASRKTVANCRLSV